MKRYRLLEPNEIECRVQKCSEKGVSILLYKTARTDADLLDETVGCERWENKFETINGVLFCALGVDYGGGLVWKTDAGVESNTEAKKGEASDAFKRAGFKHGIGRELYSAPFIWVPAAKCKKLQQNKNGKWMCNDDFSVLDIQYDGKERISKLAIASSGEVVYTYESEWHAPATPPNTAPASLEFRCEDCGEVLKPYRNSNGEDVPIRKHVNKSQKMFGKTLCIECISKLAGDGK